MKTKLSLALLATAGLLQAQVWDTGANGNTINGDTYRNGEVGIGVTNPMFPLHVVHSSTTVTNAGHFDLTGNGPGVFAAVFGQASDPNGLTDDLIGVRGTANGGPNNYGIVGAAWGNSSGVNIGGYFRLDGTGSGINSAAFGDNTGGSGWGGYFVGPVFSSGGFFPPSDRKLKNNIAPLTHALDKIMLLKPSTYTFKTDEFSGLSLPRTPQMGLIAQDVEQLFPELIKESGLPGRDEEGKVFATGETFKAVNYISLVPLLISAMQEQQQQIAEQRELIHELMQKVSTATGINEVKGADGFSMSQNEPNPFKGETTVHYTLPDKVRNAQMNVYDLSGKQIASFPLTEKGSSAITLSSEKLAAGIYIYSIVADDKIVDSKRMVVSQQ
jgi:hypothetical protein